MATTAQQSIPTKAAAAAYDYEVIVIGAGVSGIYQIKRLVDLGVRATVLDANSDVGGTWYNNRYPGARFDSESYTYGYSFSKELLNEWDWTERFSPQPETLRYLNFVVDKLKLREHMQFGCRIDAMHFDEQTDTWRLTLSDGRTLSSRVVVTGIGPLSTPTLPKIPGMADFKGTSFHTANWPHAALDLTGKRIGIIGTGATAIQIIPIVAQQAGHLTVFQRRANWAAPLNNGPISAAEMAAIRAHRRLSSTCRINAASTRWRPKNGVPFGTVSTASRALAFGWRISPKFSWMKKPMQNCRLISRSGSANGLKTP